MRSISIPLVTLAILTGGRSLAQPVVLEPGFSTSLQASGLPNPTQMTFDPNGRLLIATRTGRIFAFPYGPAGITGSGTVVADGVGQTLLGIGFDADGQLYASSNEGLNDTGFLARLLDLNGDGVYETQQRFVTTLPNAGHHNDQIVIDGHSMFVGMGSRTDDGEQDDVEPIPAATILRIDLTQIDFESSHNLPDVYARGFRNPFGLALDRRGRLWAGDNGQDTPLLPDKLHLVEPGRHHGFPANLAPPDAIPPMLELGLGTSADGLDLCAPDTAWGPAYADNLFIVRFDYELNDPAGVGVDLVRVRFDGFDTLERPAIADSSVFARGFYHPLDAQFDPYGNLLVMEYGSYSGPPDGAIYRIARIDDCLGDLDLDRDVDLTDLSQLLAHFGTPSGASRDEGDLDQDGDVDLSDLARLLTSFGGICP